MLRRICAIAVLAAVGLFVWGPEAMAQEENKVDPYATSTKICQMVINEDIEEEFPKAKGISWDMDSVGEEDAKREVRLTGLGSYKGDSGKKREFEFECTYDKGDERVSGAWWQSSFDRKRHVVVESGDKPETPESEVNQACRRAVLDEVREGFPSSVKNLELLSESIERSIADGVHELAGEGRFQGGGGTWRRFTFTCSYDAHEAEVTAASWRHLGAEEDQE